jgi:uncharacterized radical SAM superfamily Fe-S cluster-containing enzyme
MENNNININDLLSVLGNPAYLNSDMQRAFSMLQNGIENTYVKKIYQMAEKETERVKKQPSKEVILLRALKNYAAPEACRQIDRIIHILNTTDIIRHVNHSVLSYSPSIDIKSEDKKQSTPSAQGMAAMADILMLMALMKQL